PKHGCARKIFHLVIFRSAGAVGIDVVNVARYEAGVVDRISYAANDRLAVGARASAGKSIGHLTTTFDHTKYTGAARFGSVVAFQDQCASAFGHYEAIAILGERLGCGMRCVVAG